MSSSLSEESESLAVAAAASSSAPQRSVQSLFDSEFSELGRVELRQKGADVGQLVCQAYALRLGRLLASDTRTTLRRRVRELFGVRRSRDLIHTVCALYDTCLPDIGAQAVYDCITHPKAFTVMLVKSEAVECKTVPDAHTSVDVEPSEYESDDCLSVLLDETEHDSESPFKNVFSDGSSNDTSEDDDDDEDDDADQDNTAGVRSFLAQNTVTQPKLPGQDERVIDLELLSVRRKYRSAGAGKYLVGVAQNSALVGSYDAVVTCADADAVAFYEKHAFSTDAILNSRYESVGDIWTNTTRMCYIPPYEASVSANGSFIEQLAHMERDCTRWSKIVCGAYQSQAKLFAKLKNEVFALKASLCAKDSVIDELRVRNDLLERQNRFFRIQLRQLGQDPDAAPDADDGDDNENLDDIIASLESMQPKS